MSSVKQHAESEFRLAGWMRADGTFEDEMQESMVKGVLALLDAFAALAHSGFSAPYVVEMFHKLAFFDVLSPLTGADDEWADCGEGVFRNKRCGHVFKHVERFDGQAYDLNAVVFREGGVWTYTNQYSARPIVFPYTPTTVTIDVKAGTTAEEYEAEAAQAWLNRSLK